MAYGGSYGNQAYGAATPALRAPRPSGITSALASGYGGMGSPLSGARSSYTDPYAASGSLGGTGGGSGGPVASPSAYAMPAMPTYAPVAPPNTPTTYAGGNVVSPGNVTAGDGSMYDLNTDPVLQQAKAMASNQRAGAESTALKLRKGVAVDYGDSAYGATIDPATAEAARQNPFSILANLASQYSKNTATTEEDLNNHNLFYGGARIKALAGGLHDYQGQQATAAGAEQNALGGIDQNRIAALMGADQSEQSAYEGAYHRALQWALAHPAIAAAPAAPSAPAGPQAIPANAPTALAPQLLAPGPTQLYNTSPSQPGYNAMAHALQAQALSRSKFG
jgi:hypothetical protein